MLAAFIPGQIPSGVLMVVGLVWTAVLLLVLLLFAMLDWPGQLDPEATKDRSQVYGEAVRWNSRIRQPWSIWSDLGFVVLGLATLAIACFLGGDVPPNPMAAASWSSLFFGLLFVYLGPGSMYFHAGLARWGGVADGVSLSGFMSFLFFYNLWRVAGLPAVVAIVLWIALMAGTVVILWFKDSLGKVFFASWLGLTAILEILIHLGVVGGGRYQRALFWLNPAALCFGVAFTVWKLSQKGGPLFRPTAPMPGHAWWHLGCAAAVFFLYFYFRSEGLN